MTKSLFLTHKDIYMIQCTNLVLIKLIQVKYFFDSIKIDALSDIFFNNYEKCTQNG